MKKTLAILALATATLGMSVANANVSPEPIAPLAAPAPTAAPTVVLGMVNVTGASTLVGNPPRLKFKGKQAADADFNALYAVSQDHPTWTVAKVVQGDTVSRLVMKAKGVSLEMDIATEFVNGLNITKGSVLEAQTARSGPAAMVKFLKGKTTVGFMTNDATTVNTGQ